MTTHHSEYAFEDSFEDSFEDPLEYTLLKILSRMNPDERCE